MRSRKTFANGWRTRAGFTLVEMMVLIVIFGLLAVIATPAVNDYVRTNRLTTATDRMTADLKQARAQAIATGDILQFVAWEGGYVIWNVNDGSLLANRRFEGTVAAQAVTTINFFPWGMSTPGAVNLENSHNTVRNLNILPTGIVEVH